MDLFPILYAIILGIVQGTTEFLPVSSSAHLIVVSWFYSGETLPLSLNVALHIGTLSAVLIYFKQDWVRICRASLMVVQKKPTDRKDIILIIGLIIGTIPAGVIGLLWKDEIESTFHHPSFIIYPLAIVGLLLWIVLLHRFFI